MNEAIGAFEFSFFFDSGDASEDDDYCRHGAIFHCKTDK